MDHEALTALRSALGGDAVEEHAPVDLDGVGVSLTLRPADAEEVGAALRELALAHAAAIVRGGGNRLSFGHPPLRADAFLSTERLSRVVDFDRDEGVCHAHGGTPLADVRAIVNAEGWELPLDPPGATSTVGGALAAAAVGPRTLGFGLPRDQVLGLEVVLASGERTQCGGRVVKNVTGYDLNKLYTGSFGTLGVIEGAWLRLRPLPERVVSHEARISGLHDSCRLGLEAARRPSARSVGLIVEPAAGVEVRLVAELAGDAETVAQDEAWLAGEAASSAAPDARGELMERQIRVPGRSGLRFRIAALPSRLETALGELARAGATLLAHPGLGLVYAGVALPDEPDQAAPGAADAAFELAARVARESGGAFVCEAAPAWAKRGRDVFGALSVALPLIKTLKAGFDPEGVLNRGRFVGHV